jgi:hypothetical protein
LIFWFVNAVLVVLDECDTILVYTSIRLNHRI